MEEDCSGSPFLFHLTPPPGFVWSVFPVKRKTSYSVCSDDAVIDLIGCNLRGIYKENRNRTHDKNLWLWSHKERFKDPSDSVIQEQPIIRIVWSIQAPPPPNDLLGSCESASPGVRCRNFSFYELCGSFWGLNLFRNAHSSQMEETDVARQRLWWLEYKGLHRFTSLHTWSHV